MPLGFALREVEAIGWPLPPSNFSCNASVAARAISS